MPELREACDYLMIPFDANVIKCQDLSEFAKKCNFICFVGFYFVYILKEAFCMN